MKVQIRLDHIQIVRIATDFFSIFFTFTKRSTFCFFNTFFGDFLLVLEAIDLILLRLIVLSNRVVLFIKTSLWKLLYIFIPISGKFNKSLLISSVMIYLATRFCRFFRESHEKGDPFSLKKCTHFRMLNSFFFVNNSEASWLDEQMHLSDINKSMWFWEKNCLRSPFHEKLIVCSSFWFPHS